MFWLRLVSKTTLFVLDYSSSDGTHHNLVTFNRACSKNGTIKVIRISPLSTRIEGTLDDNYILTCSH